ncbi:MAG: adenosine kinase, partial [Bradyrhizobium sp.]|nr:adenosine kinase [Bradyrhizobium sp.]
MRKAIEIARAAGRKVAFTLSDVFCISRHGDDFRKLIEDGMIDILFANENELLALCQHEAFEAAVQHLHGKVPVLVVTRSEKGAMALVGAERVEVPAEPIARLVDTTGAGDMFAAGFLHGQARGHSVKDSLRLGALCAAEIIQHYGARAEVDLKVLAEEKLG